MCFITKNQRINTFIFNYDYKINHKNEKCNSLKNFMIKNQSSINQLVVFRLDAYDLFLLLIGSFKVVKWAV
ncbi:hypothetical protein EL17_13445 [Anditalea andensis]|uniref:Uncharacterized protein n=1 Tax=Anditalea andensis TaxID=1048983 RepID=A0A074KYN8_9BACT|nr:hypothetical protein EL17_13445 [Anditalea andensis]